MIAATSMQNVSDLIAAITAVPQLDLMITALLMLLFAIILLRMRRQLQRERRRRKEIDKQLLNALQRITRLEDQLDSLATAPSAAAAKETAITSAELKTRLQTPNSGGSAPDKYRHVAALAAQGMSTEQIAEVLKISLPEANQLVSLARIASSKAE